MKAAIEGREMQVEDVVRIADEASEVLQFNRALLQGAIENITQGISVVDQSLRLVAWNHRYLELFEYPDGLIYVGRPIADIIRYNADRGLCGPGDPDMHVAKRLYWMRQGTPHTSERLFPNGRVIELIGNPMPGGGFVMSFTDITAYREAEQGLKGANESLEQRVQERTQELSQLNQELSEAKSNAEAANQSKTRFLAAVSHDLMQPLNAARLFSAALAHQDALPGEVRDLVQHLDSSLRSAEDLITDLLDISRLESGRVSAERNPFPLNNLYDALGVEFKALAQEQGLHFRLRGSQLRVDSDIKLLRRILQNFLTNAFPSPRATCCSACAARTAACAWKSGIRGRASHRTSRKSSSKSSSAWTATRPARRKASVSAWRSPTGSARSSAIRWRYVPGRARAASSASAYRWRGRRRRPWPTATRPNRRKR